MKIYNTGALDKFIKRHRTAKSVIEAWKAIVNRSSWEKPEDFKREFRRTRHIDKNRWVFKLGNDWRIDVITDFTRNKMFIKRIGTHEEYNNWKFD